MEAGYLTGADGQDSEGRTDGLAAVTDAVFLLVPDFGLGACFVNEEDWVVPEAPRASGQARDTAFL